METTTTTVTRTAKGYLLHLPDGHNATTSGVYSHAVIGHRPDGSVWVTRHKSAAGAATSAADPAGAVRVEVLDLAALAALATD